MFYLSSEKHEDSIGPKDFKYMNVN